MGLAASLELLKPEVLERAAAGDRESLEEVLRIIQRPFFNLASRMLHEPLHVIELPNAGETAHAAALALPGGALISGDLLMNHVHLYLGECHSDGWQQNLAAVKAMGFTKFYPGHGVAPVDVSVFADDTGYIAAAIPILRAAEVSDASAGDAGDPRVGAAIGEITAKLPDFESQFVLGFSTSTFIDTNKCP